MHIQIEGCEASGKSTLINQLESHFKELNYSVITEHFPTNNTPFGLLAREILDSQHSFKNYNFYITLLSIADQKLYSELNDYNKPYVYLQSRGILSSLVYSDLYTPGFTSFTSKILTLFEDIPLPDIIIYLKPDISLVKSRLATRSYSNIYDQISLIETIQNKYDAIISVLSSKVNILPVSVTSNNRDTLNIVKHFLKCNMF